MDRRQMLVQRVRELFGERLDDLVHIVRQDRQELRGWEEPAHFRAVIRRAIRERGSHELDGGEITFVETEFARAAGEPDRGQQREAIGQLLEVGATGVEKLSAGQLSELMEEELLGLECIILLYARPAVLVNQGKLASVPSFWNILEDQREDIELVQRGVGRLELMGHPEYDWAGGGFLVNENCLMTTRRTAELFAENQGDLWQFRPGITAWMDYRSQHQHVSTAGYRIRGLIGIHSRYDLALLEVDPPQQANGGPMPLALATEPPKELTCGPVYLVGYPVRDDRRGEPETVTRIFRDIYNVKRVHPGLLRGTLQFRDLQLLQHDCAPLGNTGGSCIIDLETHRVLGMHLSGRYLEWGTAIPLWVLRDDPLLRRAGVTFTDTSAEDMNSTTSQIERLARSRHWPEVRAAITNWYQRAFGAEATRPSSGS